MRTIVSPCGTSLITNLGGRTGVTVNGQLLAPEAVRDLVNRYANADLLDSTVAPTFDALIAEARSRLDTLPWAKAESTARASAEIHAWTKLDKKNGDLHYVLHSDTWLGTQIAEMLVEWLMRHGLAANAIRIDHLRTDNPSDFQLAMGNLAAWLKDTFEPNRNSSEVIFQLSGGFKAMQGVLQSLAPFYADRVVYLFESSPVLLDLPRLPVQWDVDDSVRDALTPLRRMGLNLPADAEALRGLSTLYWVTYEDRLQLTPVGNMMWNTLQSRLYAEAIWDPPSPQIRFGPEWAASVKNLASDRRAKINERMDDFVRWVETGTAVNRLDVKKLKGTRLAPSTHECDAWHDQAAWRIFCHSEGPVWIWDRLGPHL